MEKDKIKFYTLKEKVYYYYYYYNFTVENLFD